MQWLMSQEGYNSILIGSFIYAGVILIGAFMSRAPYGRFGIEGVGLSLSPRGSGCLSRPGWVGS